VSGIGVDLEVVAEAAKVSK